MPTVILATTAHKSRTVIRNTILAAVVVLALVLSSFFIAMQMSPAKAAPATPDNYFVFDEVTQTITSYDPTGGSSNPDDIITDVVIPDTINSVPVRFIAPYKGVADDDGPATTSFSGKGLTSLVVGDSIERIGGSAFADNPLISVVIGTAGYTGPAAMLIDGGNFNGSLERATLSSVEIGSVVREIIYSFNNTSIAMLSLSKDVETVTSSFMDSHLTSFTYEGGATFAAGSFTDNAVLESLVIDTTGNIASGAFNNLPRLQSLVITRVNNVSGGSLHTLSSAAVDSFDITIEKAESIADGSFGALSRVTSIIITEVGSIRDDAFSAMSNAYASEGLVVSIEKAGNITNSFGGFSNLRSITLTDVGDIDYSFRSMGVSTLGDMQPVDVDIKKAGDIIGSSFTIPTLFRVDIGEVGDIVQSFSAGTSTSIAELETKTLAVTVDYASRIDWSFNGHPHLSSVAIQDVGDIADAFSGNNLWAITDTAPSLDVDITSARDITASFGYFPQLSSVKIGTSRDILSSSFSGSGASRTQMSSRLEVELGVVRDIRWSSFASQSHMSDVTIGTVALIDGGSFDYLSGIENIILRTVTGDIASSFNYAGVADVSKPQRVTIERIDGDITNASFSSLPRLVSFRVDVAGSAITNGSLTNNEALKEVVIGRTGHNDTARTAIRGDYGAFGGSNAIEKVVLYDTVLSVAPGTFADKRVTEIFVSGNVPLTTDVIGGNNSNTGEYIRIYTHPLGNPYGYQDAFVTDDGDVVLAYIINPAKLTVRYVDQQTGVVVAPSHTAIGNGVNNYSIADNPVMGGDYQSLYAKYYRAGASVSLAADAVAGYTTPADESFLVDSYDAQYTFSYSRPVPVVTPGGGNPQIDGGVSHEGAIKPSRNSSTQDATVKGDSHLIAEGSTIAETGAVQDSTDSRSASSATGNTSNRAANQSASSEDAGTFSFGGGLVAVIVGIVIAVAIAVFVLYRRRRQD